MTKMVYSILARKEVPAVEPKPNLRAVSLEPRVPAETETIKAIKALHNDVAYLKVEPQERAKREAQPLIEAERAERTRLEAEGKARADVAAAAHAAETTRLRDLLREADIQTETAHREASVRDARILETERLAQETAERHRQELEAARRERQPLPAILAPVPPPMPAPEEIEFEPHKDTNGLLRALLIKSPGYSPLLVEVMRGADNRMRNLKARNP